MNSKAIDKLIKFLQQKIKNSPEPMTREIVRFYGKNPYFILISCLLSLRTRDVVTLPVSVELFKHVQTPQQMVQVSLEKLEQLIKPINYYKRKAQQLKSVSQELLDRFDGQVPPTRQELLSIKGIGIKTANLVLAEAFNVPAICVDTHVHRLSNHWGLVATQTPEQTEQALRELLPKTYWIDWNYLLVKWGQHVCKKSIVPCLACEPVFALLKA